MLILKKNRTITLLCLLALAIALAGLFMRFRSSMIQARSRKPVLTRMSSFPKLFLWAWERPEKLGFINPKEIGVAFLAETVYLNENHAVARPRLQPLEVPAGTTLVAVVRIESARGETPSLSDEQRKEVVESLLDVAGKPNVSALQIDFDATLSQREFYKHLLREVRDRLPESVPLSMTALASWCIFDTWVTEMPVDEAVPMLFQMGVDQHRISDYLNAGGGFRSSQCRQSIGISTDENKVAVPGDVRVYAFSPNPWSESTVQSVLERSRNAISVP